MGLDGAVGRGVGDAGEGEALGELVVVEEALLRVVHLAGHHLARTRGARAGPARVRKINTGLLRHIEDILVARALNHLR